MAKDLNTFREKFQGTRPNRFVVNIGKPAGLEATLSPPTNLDLYVKAASAPGSSIGIIPTPWMGRVVKFSGERTYADWTIQVYDSSVNNTDLRTFFEGWIDKMDSRNQHDIDYKLTANATVKWNDINAATGVGVHGDQTNFKSIITLRNAFPIDISLMELNYDLIDTFAEFTITLAYDYWEFGGP